MQDVFVKASALGEAIQQSEEYRAMRAAEAAVMANEEAAGAMRDFLAYRTQVEEMLTAENPDRAALAEHSHAMEALQERLGGMGLVAEMTRARAAFADMMRQVNQVLRFMVTGEMDEDAGGCGGDCGGCAGGCNSGAPLQ
jgi:cell fate (sporulation/competence/biofilm development) regulator YlbF (YheA/YmcA/DUF963 family)